jgi:membrane protein YdbS with pleckstrin-like domain
LDLIDDKNNDKYLYVHPRPQAQAWAALAVALVEAVKQLIVIGSFALKECCGCKGNAGSQ